MRKETYEDGWDCEPKLKEAVQKIEEMHSYLYEINNCVRLTELETMVVEMKELCEDATTILDDIDCEIEYKTVDDEE